MVVFSTPTFDLDGSVTLSELSDSEFGNLSRRNSRVATLDGSSVLSDYGYSDSDRTIIVKAKMTNASITEQLQRLVKLYSELILSCRDGIFLGAISKLKLKKSVLTITFLVMEEI